MDQPEVIIIKVGFNAPEFDVIPYGACLFCNVGGDPATRLHKPPCDYIGRMEEGCK